MAILPENLDYTDKDFDSIRARLINLARSVFSDWTDFNVSTFGNMVLESYAFIADLLLFYQDNQSREAFLTDVTLRRNAIALAKRLGFVPQGAVAATADVLFTLDEVPANDVTIPAGTVVKTADVTDAVEFQLLLDLTIPAATDPPQAFGTVENSEDQQDTFSSTSLPNQEVQLNGTPYLDQSGLVTAGNGGYTQVDNFLSSDANDRHYVVVVDENDRATFRFGNGVNGEIPNGTITIDYKVGGGADGNVDANTITLIDGSFTDALSNPVSVSVNNSTAASGGSDRQTVEQIKLFAPEELRVLNRTVSREDYEIGARGVAGVARALLLTSDQAGGIPENSGFLYVVPDGGGLPSQALKDSVLTAVTVDRRRAGRRPPLAGRDRGGGEGGHHLGADGVLRNLERRRHAQRVDRLRVQQEEQRRDAGAGDPPERPRRAPGGRLGRPEGRRQRQRPDHEQSARGPDPLPVRVPSAR